MLIIIMILYGFFFFWDKRINEENLFNMMYFKHSLKMARSIDSVKP